MGITYIKEEHLVPRVKPECNYNCKPHLILAYHDFIPSPDNGIILKLGYKCTKCNQFKYVINLPTKFKLGEVN
jgi:hypothetical protein